MIQCISIGLIITYVMIMLIFGVRSDSTLVRIKRRRKVVNRRHSLVIRQRYGTCFSVGQKSKKGGLV